MTNEKKPTAAATTAAISIYFFIPLFEKSFHLETKKGKNVICVYFADTTAV